MGGKGSTNTGNVARTIGKVSMAQSFGRREAPKFVETKSIPV